MKSQVMGSRGSGFCKTHKLVTLFLWVRGRGMRLVSLCLWGPMGAGVPLGGHKLVALPMGGDMVVTGWTRTCLISSSQRRAESGR